MLLAARLHTAAFRGPIAPPPRWIVAHRTCATLQGLTPRVPSVGLLKSIETFPKLYRCSNTTNAIPGPHTGLQICLQPNENRPRGRFGHDSRDCGHRMYPDQFESTPQGPAEAHTKGCSRRARTRPGVVRGRFELCTIVHCRGTFGPIAIHRASSTHVVPGPLYTTAALTLFRLFRLDRGL